MSITIQSRTKPCCGLCLFAEAVTSRSLQSAPVSPSQTVYQRPQLPDYQLAVRRLKERRPQRSAVVQHSRVRSLDSEPE